MDVNLFCFITNLIVITLCAALLAIIPTLTRKAFLFGVKVPEAAQEHHEAKAMKTRYIATIIAGMCLILMLATVQFMLWPHLTVACTMYFPLLLIAVQALAFIPNWKKAVRLKAENNWHVSNAAYSELRSSHSRGNASMVPWAYYIATFIIILASMIIALKEYPYLPDPYPTHFDMNMVADAWAPKSLWVVLMLPLINFSVLVLMAVVALAIVKQKLQISPENPPLSFAQHRVYRRWMGHGMGILTLGITISMTLLYLGTIWPEWQMSFWLMMLLLLLPCVPTTWVTIRAGQGGCKLKPKITEADSFAKGHGTAEAFPGRGDDKYWALGMFYHNPEDPAILVEDRFGANMGFNYSHLVVKIGVAVFLAAMVAMYVWVTPMLLQG